MTTRIFSAVAAIAMALAAGLTAVSRNLSQQFAAAGKKPVVVIALIAGLEAMFCFLLTIAEDEPFVVFWIFCLFFLFAGILQFRLFHRAFSPMGEENPYRPFSAEILINAASILFTLALFSLLEYFFRNKGFLFYPLLFSGLFFLVPLFFYHTWQSAIQIPPAVFAVWEYPISTPLPMPEDNANERLLVIGFDLPKKLMEKKTFFRAKTPEDIRLGELFYHFINDYNELQSETPIHYTDGTGLPLSWGFRVKRKWYARHKVLDPALTVKQNGIKENSVIICEHITLTN